MGNVRFGGGFPSVPPVIKNLIIINALMWLAELTFKDVLVTPLALHYQGSPEFGIWQLISYMFLHDTRNIFHLLFNMLMLWMFGAQLEQRWGAKRFLLFYIVCGIGAGLIQLLANQVELNIVLSKFNSGAMEFNEFRYRAAMIQLIQVLGASGAIMGVMAGFTYLNPNQELFLFLIPFPIKMKYAMVGYVLIDLFGGINPGYGGGVAHFAHLGGALFGFILVIIMNRNNRRTFY
ncbi:rhomboid family intramembrane serine protease [Pseudoflavitalea sp. G-6-1-2]|uniref:rhomboid family intramembrane serine protease n=1 Tax=Pseudoflavitalea sp. G-6-1-2 TaxID=2728841 RepID=UPI00146BD0AE|nr:rhomboid family intramembrane serine protease [Pseudoflavitalea sp. G-6-1-2]NML20177.1 rhomboid family intramembrane serine protease [Pseudoflavitalea sp. G-6-1-2]